MMMKEGLPNLAHSRLEDVIRQAGSLNILRSVSVESIMVARFLVVWPLPDDPGLCPDPDTEISWNPFNFLDEKSHEIPSIL